MFPEESLQTFLTSPFQVTPQSNRMGYRLSGPALRHRGAADVLSDAVVTGSIQVPADGQPIVLMADRQTTGGYAKIATVISVDLPAMAQARPGAKVSFRPVSVDEAQELAIQVEKTLSTLQSGCGL
jgi:antagonist of KipI